MHPTLTEGWHELGNVHAAQGKYEAALADFARARQQRPKDPTFVCATGKVLAKLNRRAEAIAQFHEAIRLQPDYWEPHFELGGQMVLDNNIGDAKTEFANVVRLRPDFPLGHFNLAVALMKQDQLDEAEREFEATIRLDASNKSAQAGLRQVQTLKNRKR
jgi:Flp pilus assembly protein TadD